MGEISGKIADFTFITTDNPRTEEPEEIVKEIEEGMKKTNGKYKVVVDRKEARVGGAGQKGAHPIGLQGDEKKTFGDKLHDKTSGLHFCPV